MGILDIFKKFTGTAEPETKKVMFPNAVSSKEEYENQKRELEETALADTVFWDKIDLPDLTENKKHFEAWTCPYCGEKLPEKKSTHFTCPNCKNKVLKKRLLLSGEYGLFQETDKDILDEYWGIFTEHKDFLKIWNGINNRLPEVIPKTYNTDKTKNIQLVLTTMRLGHISYYQKEKVHKLRDCRYTEGLLQQIYGTTAQATNCFMQVLYLDMIDDAFMNLNGTIAPAIYSWAFAEKLSEEEFKKIFIFNAENVIKNVRYDVPITPEDAWQKLKEYSPES